MGFPVPGQVVGALCRPYNLAFNLLTNNVLQLKIYFDFLQKKNKCLLLFIIIYYSLLFFIIYYSLLLFIIIFYDFL
jgi:hypothetical protein